MSGQEMAVTDKPVFRFWLLICVLFVAACTVRLETAQLKSPDLTFTALDGSFKVIKQPDVWTFGFMPFSHLGIPI
jgi:hypothetical protein